MRANAGAKSTSVTERNAKPPASSELPCAVAPSAAHMPAPASLVAVPPTPIVMWEAPASMAAAIN